MTDKPKLKACPKCGGVEIEWTEFSTHIQVFNQDEAGINPIGWTGEGGIASVAGRCEKCGHKWTPRAGSRRAIMVSDLPGYPTK
jgi:predicted RNA-binding Zn-ribbon protein involved in translation (DUF1610 family)